MRKIIPSIIVLSLVLPSFLPSFVQVAQAGPLDSTIGFTSCTAGGFITNSIRDQINDLDDWATEKIRGLFGIESILSDEVPVADKSFKGSYVGKESVQDLIARCAAREILTAMGRNITNTARTGGRDGGPAWVRNWRNFRLDSQYRGEGVFKAMLASTNTCEYFTDDIQGLFGANRKVALTRIQTRIGDVDSYQVRAGCTLPTNFNYDNYKRDFSGNGGWEAWSRLMEPQNNFYGSLFQAQDEMNRQRSIEEQASVDEAGATGFTAIRGRSASDSCAVKSPYAGGGCLIYKDIATPSGILSGAVVAGIETELQWVATTDEVSELIATGIEVLFNRLWNLSNPNEGSYTVPGSLDVSITPFPTPTPTTTPTNGGGGGGADSDSGGGGGEEEIAPAF